MKIKITTDSTADVTPEFFEKHGIGYLPEIVNLGGEEYFDKGICLIEWGEQIEDALPSEYIKIIFNKDEQNDDVRVLNFEAFGEKYESILDKLQSEL